MNKFIFLVVFAFVCFSGSAVKAQPGYAKIADDTIGYIKASTFGKPDVAKKTSKLALSQVRVHYKIVTTRAAETRDNGARVTVYLDGEMTNDDLQRLTDEFYTILQNKLGALGITFADWNAIAATEYFNNREDASAEKNNINSDGGNGQAWVSFTANKGPVIYRYSVDQTKMFGNELLAYSKMKKLSKMAETLDADLATFDAVVDFTSIVLNTEKDTVWQDGGKYLRYGANYSIGAMMSVPQSYVLFLNRKNGFDQYASKLPIGQRDFFSDKPYEDASKASYKTKTIFGDTKFAFTPVVINARRDLYIAAARRALALYADVFAEKMRLIRAGEKPTESNKQVADTKGDGKTLKQVTEEAKKNNETTAVTYNEMMRAGKDAEGKNNVNLAIEYYSQAIKQYPEQTDAYVARMLASEKLKNWESVTKDSEAILKIDSNHLLAKYALGTSHLFRANYKKSAQVLGEIVQANPNFMPAVSNYGLSLAGLKKFSEAESILSNGINTNPRNAGLFRARAAVYKVQGRTDLAQADELRAVQLERGQ